MNILYLGVTRTKKNSGGNVIRERNVRLLQEIADTCDIILYKPYTKIFFRCFFAIFNKVLCFRFFDNFKLFFRLKQNKFDFIFIDSSLIGKINKRILKNNKTICFFHNVEAEYWNDYIKKYHGIKKLIFSIFVSAVCKNERHLVKNCNYLITLNQRDSNKLLELYGKEADLLWPTSFIDSFEKKQNSNENYLLFVGMDFFGNTEGLFWFIENCMPFINYKFIIAGNGMDKYKNKYKNPNVVFEGYVEDLSELYNNANAILLPIISGSGMKTKTCEALMYGKKIFGTDEAFMGYNDIDKTSCIRCNTVQSFVDQINLFINSDEVNNKYYDDVRTYFLNNFEETAQNCIVKDFLESI